MKQIKDILILGGNGFIGRNLCRSLVREGYSVCSFDRFLPQETISGVNYIEGDFFDDVTLKHIIKNRDVIYHAISTINPGNSNTDFMRGYQKDYLQTVKLCEYLKQSHCKLIFLSSGGTVYGIQKVQPIKENSLPYPINHYGNIKLSIENTLLIFKQQNNLDVTIARISNPFGPGQDYKKGVGFIDAVIRNSLSNGTIEVFGDGTNIRDYIYIDDVCDYLTSLAQIELGDAPIVNISSGVGASNNDILEIVRRIHGHVNVIYKDSRSVDLKKVVLDNSKVIALTHKTPHSLEDAILKYYNYIKSLC